MTLAPLVRPDIRGVEGKPGELSKWCVVPGCLSLSQQRHHLWPKSFLRGQPYEWVEVGGRVICNSVGLCVRHHNMVTSPIGGHQARIVFNTDLELFEWQEMVDFDFESLGLLRNQSLVEPEPEAHRVRREEGLCPTCGRAEPRAKRQTVDGLPKRPAKSWSVLVPKDSEDGADVLDTYIEDLAVIMGLDPQSPRLLRYHVLAPVLAWVIQNKPSFISDWEEAQAA